MKYINVAPPKNVSGWEGKTIRTKVQMSNGFGTIPPGTIMTISGKASKKSLCGSPCQCCGVAPKITLKGDRKYILELVEFVQEIGRLPLSVNSNKPIEIDSMSPSQHYRISYPEYTLIGKLKRHNGVNLFWSTPVILVSKEDHVLGFSDWSPVHNIDIIKVADVEDIELLQNMTKIHFEDGQENGTL